MAVKLCFSLLAKASVLYYSNCLNQFGKETEKTRGFGKIVEEWGNTVTFFQYFQKD